MQWNNRLLRWLIVLTSFVAHAHTNEGMIPNKVSEKERKYKTVKQKKNYFIQGQRKSPVLQLFLTLELHLLLVKERKKRRYVPFPSNIELSFLSGSSFSETPYDSFPADLDLCCSAARLAWKQVYSALLPPPALRKVNQGPIGSSFLTSPPRCSFLKGWSQDSSTLLKL